MSRQVTLGQRVMRLALCATVSGLALAAQTAHAAIIVVDFSGSPLTVPFDINGVYLNVVTGATGVAGSSTPGWDLNPYFANTTSPTLPAGFRFFSPSGIGGMVGAAGIVTPLTAGSSISGASSFINGVMNANQAIPGTNYFGFRFLNEATTLTNYGYVVVQQTANPVVKDSVKLLGYAYENSGAAITISAVPEPSSVLMMFGGLLAVGAMSKRLSARRPNAA